MAANQKNACVVQQLNHILSRHRASPPFPASWGHHSAKILHELVFGSSAQFFQTA